jgi:lipoprotein-releasing system permease protein
MPVIDNFTAKGLAMYKMILCQRYLRTRYIALASIISVTLGVATMIVVNSVMAGFGTEMRSRIQGILSDIIIETRSTNGEFDPDFHKQLVRELVGKYIAGVTATVEVHAILSYPYGGEWVPHPVILVGIDPESKSEVGPLVEYLQSYRPRTENGKEIPAERSLDETLGWELTPAMMAARIEKRKRKDEIDKLQREIAKKRKHDQGIDAETSAEPHHSGQTADASSGDQVAESDSDADMLKELINGPNTTASDEENVATAPLGALMPGRIYVGEGLASYIQQDPETQQNKTYVMIKPGDDVKFTTYVAGTPSPVYFDATVVDTFKTGMSDYDSNLVYCNIEYLQQKRKMIRENEDGSKVGAFTQLQIKLKDYKNAPKVMEILRSKFTPDAFIVKTWEQRQGPLLAAVDVESSILNILLFLIITVAGFGILAIFFMIVVEKTRDIGILKALGASSSGVMSIFLTYGLLLGIVGAGAGVVFGLLFVHYINQIEAFVTFVTGREVFPEKIYYFKDIPTHVEPLTVVWVSVGAIMIAVLASVLPARRAARLRPVQALRYE